MIIDSHVHYGHSAWGNFSPEFLLDVLGEEVDYAICSNLEGIESPEFKTEFECNAQMLEVAKKYPKLKPLLVCQPNISENVDVIKSFLENNNEFIGLKFHPECMKLPADSEKYDKYLQLAQVYNKPCLYHSGHIKSRFSSPKLIYKKAQEFPNVPIILGHLSTGPKQSHIEAIEILLESIEKENALLYVDVSWIDFAFEKLNETYEDTLMLIDALKNTSKGDYTHRILWASDAPVGEFNHAKESYSKNLSIFKQRVLERFADETLLENLLANNAKALYRL
jgi:predicted TIM-barrel fold metal-dependent hydrolase